MLILVIWGLISALIGYLGSDRKGGFWGFFFFSFILSPLVAGLALLLGGGSKAAAQREVVTRQRQVAAARERGPSIVVDPRELIRIAVLWAASILLFGALYALAFSLTWNSLLQAFELSLQVGTLGFNVQPPGDAPALITDTLFALQRMTVLGLLVLAISRLMAARQALLIQPLAKSEDVLHSLSQLEAKLAHQERLIQDIHLQSASVAAIAAPVGAAIHPPDEPVTVASRPS